MHFSARGIAVTSRDWPAPATALFVVAAGTGKDRVVVTRVGDVVADTLDYAVQWHRAGFAAAAPMSREIAERIAANLIRKGWSTVAIRPAPRHA